MASVTLQQLHDSAPVDWICLRWVVERLHRQSFPMILLLLTIPGMVPGICSFAELLMAMLAVQMMIGNPRPWFPLAFAERPLPAQQIHRVVPHVIAALRLCEKIVHPRCPGAVQATRRLIGAVVLLLSVRMLLIPIPFSNVLPTAALALIALADIEGDGLLLAISVLVGLTMLAIDGAFVVGIIRGAAWF